jgi:hypothetical protein
MSKWYHFIVLNSRQRSSAPLFIGLGDRTYPPITVEIFVQPPECKHLKVLRKNREESPYNCLSAITAHALIALKLTVTNAVQSFQPKHYGFNSELSKAKIGANFSTGVQPFPPIKIETYKTPKFACAHSKTSKKFTR